MRIITLLKTNNKLTLPIFLEFVELKTKVASFFPMVIGYLFAAYHFKAFQFWNTVLFTLAVLSFDMCTTAINNTMDFKKALDEEYLRDENVIGKHGLDFRHMVSIIWMLLCFAIFFSLILVLRTDLLLLPLGVLCFLIGIFYTYGPFPLSRLPLGELFSGVTMGFGIYFLAIFVQRPEVLLSSQWAGGDIFIHFSWLQTLLVFFMSLPLVNLIANIMLANNLCDYDQDVRNGRFTLVHYISVKNGVKLYTFLNVSAWVFLAVYPIWGLIPYWSWLGLLAFPLNLRSLIKFRKKQIKRETFVESIKSFVLLSGLYVVILMIALILK